MRIGTLVHLAVLEPERYLEEIAVKPGGTDYRTKEGKEWRAKAGDRMIIDQDDADMLKGISDSVWANDDARSFLEASEKEVSLFLDHDSGLRLKGRADMLGEDFIADIKTTECAQRDAFAKTIINFNYHVQAAMYLLLTGKPTFTFVCVEKVPPYAVAVYQLDPRAVDLGRKILNTAIATVALCEETSEWPGYQDGMEFIDLPAWAYTR